MRGTYLTLSLILPFNLLLSFYGVKNEIGRGFIRGTLLPLSSAALLSERLQVPVPCWQGECRAPTGNSTQPGVLLPCWATNTEHNLPGQCLHCGFAFESKGVKDGIEELRIVTKQFLYFSLSRPNLVIWPPAGMPNNSSPSACIFSHLFTKKEALSLIVHQP